MSNPTKPPEKSPLVLAVANAASVITLLTLSLVTYEYQHVLEPLYATAPVQYHLNKVIWSAVILSSLVPALPKASILVAGILITILPTSAYWVAAYTGRNHDVIWGPVLTHLSVLAPVLYLGIGVSKLFHDNGNGAAASSAQVMSLPVSGMALTGLRDLWAAIPFIRDADQTLVLTWIGGFAITLWLVSPFLTQEASSTPSAPAEPEKETPSPQNRRERRQLAKTEVVEAKKKKASPPSSPPEPKETPKPKETQAEFAKKHGWRVTILPVIPLLATFVRPPILPKPLFEPYVHPTAPLRVLSSVRSAYSGVVLVGEVLPPTPAQVQAGNVTEPHSMRYLRAGHSLLGGVWIGDRVYSRDGTSPLQLDSNGSAIGDSIYGTFNMQEAVRFVPMPDADQKKNALVIGLGAGISASAFMRHDVSTTIVEIDPVVYEAAEKYFALPKPEEGHLFLEDARGWVHNRRQLLHSPEAASDAATKTDNVPLFDYAIHDCFSGGGVPSHIFTLSFWEDLKAIMSPSGAVAVNFAGRLSSDSSRAVVTTLKRAFGQCRAFHDSMEEVTEEKLSNDFMNWVFFCTPSSSPLVFRDAVEADFLSSYLREQVFLTLSNREVPLDRFLQDVEEKDVEKYTLTDTHNPLSGWQEQDALHHWALMRQVLKDVFWETY
ncbi:hypothetical protein QCA50_021162 [Cerrena zonata]|uniref:PABS domain-containing protein n=1 Tax=Cerrena zonata TaxID=2478898 RepID=A0AAW0FF89_9APHY